MNVGVRETKAHLSEYLRRVRAGEVVTITDRGEVTAYLVPPSFFENHLSNVDLGIAEGWITAPASRAPLPRITRFRASASAAEILDEDRGE